MSGPQKSDTPSDFLDSLNGLPQTVGSLVDPAAAAPYPRGLALDLALESAPLPEILATYNLTAVDLQRILKNAAFKRELEGYREELKTDGFSFRQKAKAQAEAYLGTAWQMVHDPSTPSAVKADLIKNTVRWAQLDTPPTPGQAQANPLPAQVLDDLKNLPDGELEVRVMQILYKRGQSPTPDPVGGITYDADVSEH